MSIRHDLERLMVFNENTTSLNKECNVHDLDKFCSGTIFSFLRKT